jgi:hypothetical protein
MLRKRLVWVRELEAQVEKLEVCIAEMENATPAPCTECASTKAELREVQRKRQRDVLEAERRGSLRDIQPLVQDLLTLLTPEQFSKAARILEGRYEVDADEPPGARVQFDPSRHRAGSLLGRDHRGIVTIEKPRVTVPGFHGWAEVWPVSSR